MVFAPLASWFAELFDAHVRYTGVSVGYQLGSLIAGAPAPIVATYLVSANGGAYLAGLTYGHRGRHRHPFLHIPRP